MMKKITKIFALVLLTFASTTALKAQAQYKLYSGFIYHFATNTQWPSAKTSGTFNITVVGGSPVTNELKALSASRKVGTRTISVKQVSSASQISSCHIIFVPKSQMGNLTVIAAKAKAINAMVVTESAGGAKKGASISFTQSGGKVAFELSDSKAKACGLTISANLKKLAIMV